MSIELHARLIFRSSSTEPHTPVSSPARRAAPSAPTSLAAARRTGDELPRPDLVLVAVVAQEGLERVRQGQLTHPVELAVVADGGPEDNELIICNHLTVKSNSSIPCKLLEAEAVPPQDGVEQHRLEEHAAQRVLVVLEQTANRSRAKGENWSQYVE